MEVKDILLYESGNGGELNLRNNDLDMVQGLANMCYIALFGGNVEENTTNETNQKTIRNDYWGNELLGLGYNSNFERSLQRVALNSSGINELETMAKLDLKELEEFAKVDVSCSLIGVGKLNLQIKLTEPDGRKTKIDYIWDGEKMENYQEITV